MSELSKLFKAIVASAMVALVIVIGYSLAAPSEAHAAVRNTKPHVTVPENHQDDSDKGGARDWLVALGILAAPAALCFVADKLPSKQQRKQQQATSDAHEEWLAIERYICEHGFDHHAEAWIAEYNKQHPNS